MEKPLDSALVWFRRDLRADDNAALYHALKAARRVWCVFVLDHEILEPLLQRGLAADRRVEFIVDSLADLDRQLAALGRAADGRTGLMVRHAAARAEIPRLAAELHVQAVYANHDDDPFALERDARVRGTLAAQGIAFHTAKDHVVFERKEVLTASGKPYTVFTPYKNAWLDKLDAFYLSAYPVARYADALAPLPDGAAAGPPPLETIGFQHTNLHSMKLPVGSAGATLLLDDFLPRIDDYDKTRDFPAVKGPSYLSVHLRFGTISIRTLAREALARMQAGSRGAAVWLSELVWRDFYHQVLHHHPEVVDAAFKPAYDAIRWEHGKHADACFAAWCEGRTGYPLVDAAMAQINQTGYMHNRLRMVAASFLVKDLGIDWRRGERYFADHLIDHDLAANNGGWQWAASTGCDAQPWFRIFNPVNQSRKFDPQGKFIRRYLPAIAALPDALIHAPWLASPIELEAANVRLGSDYPPPLVMHDEARDKTLARYAVVKEAKA
jgi:deoxyribodipyrimidine photo-lyase